MKRKDWRDLVEALNLPVCCCPHFGFLSQRFGVSEEAVSSIYSQENHRRVVQSNHRLQEQLPFLAKSHSDGQDLLDLCCNHNWPPCLLVRRLLEFPPWSLNRQKIKEVLRDPSLIFAVADWEDGDVKECHPRRALQMHSDICLALEADPGNAPAADDARRDMGLRYERLLNEQLEAQGLFFWTEDALRAKGYFKTPDAKLQVPFMYNGQTVFWIDSKATFGGDHIHQQQVLEQYQKYVNRCGPGMVVYWFGMIDELVGSDDNIVLVLQLPASSEIVKLPCLELSVDPW